MKMSLDEIKALFHEVIMPNGVYNKQAWSKNKDLRQAIDQAEIPGFDTLDEKILSIRLNLATRPGCQVCGKSTKKKGNTFSKNCSARCAILNPDTVSKIKKTNRERLGVDWPSQSKVVRKKIEKASIDRFGYKVPSMSPEVKATSAKNNLKRFGYSTLLMRPEIRAKAIEGSRTKESRDKKRHSFKNTYNERGEEIQALRKSTCLERYGAEHPSFVLSKQQFKEKLEKILEDWPHSVPLFTEWSRGAYEWRCIKCDDYLKTTCLTKAVCRGCFPISIPQGQVREMLVNLGIEFGENDRKTIAPLELDFVCGDIAIEVNGVYWHQANKEKTLLLRKTELFKGKLLHFWDFEINDKPEVVKSIISNSFGLSEVIRVEDCEVIELNQEDADRFLNETHLEGTTAGDLFLGLLLRNELVMVAGFSSLSETTWELVRLSTQLNKHVQQGLNALIQVFKDLIGAELICFDNRRFSELEQYKIAGFREVDITQPGMTMFNYRSGDLEPIIEGVELTDLAADIQLRDCGFSVLVLK